MAWRPRIVAATGISRDRFAVAYGELDYDDPFTAILDYDAAFPQPWSRTDVQREIKALAPWSPGEGDDARLVALSDEGDVYFIGGETRREKIPGAGIASDDASGAGGLFALVNLGGVLIAAGQGEQVFRRTARQRWERLAVGLAAHPEFQPVAFSRIVATAADDVYLLGRAAPVTSSLEEAMTQRFEETGDWMAMSDAFKAHLAGDGGERVDQGRAVHWDGAAFRPLDLPGPEILHDALAEAPGRVWMAGGDGAILLGDARTGFERLTAHGGALSFLSITRFGESLYLASDHALHRLDGRELSGVRPSRMLRLSPFSVQAVDGVLYYFDHGHGVHRHNGAEWARIELPDRLLERPYRGHLRAVT